MADYRLLTPFILAAEGGYVNNPADKGGETNKGIIWAVWASFYGDTKASHHRFLVMEPGDWVQLFKACYWDKCLACQITNQPVANIIVDWVWCSGLHVPQLDTQKLINSVFSRNLAEDGEFGPATIEALNSCDPVALYESLIERRRQYYRDIISFAHADGDYSQDIFLEGWLNRIDNLIKYNKELSVVS